MGVVTSTKYKKISFVVKELLIQVNGEVSLKLYAGWTCKAKYSVAVEQFLVAPHC